MIKRMITILKNAKGFSLVQGLIVAGIIAGSSLVTTRLLTDQKIAQKSTETKDQVEDLNNLVYSMLQNRANCEETIRHASNSTMLNSINGSTTNFNGTIAGIYTANNSATPAIQVDQNYINNNVRINEMRIVFPDPDASSLLGQAAFTVKYQRIGQASDNNPQNSGLKLGYGGKVIQKKFVMRIQRSPISNDFDGCYVMTNDKDDSSQEAGNDISRSLCNELTQSSTGVKAFIWDSSKNRCMPNTNKCGAGEIYTGFDSVGDVKCTALKDWIDFNSLIDTTPTGACAVGAQVRLDTTGNRIRIICN